MNRSIILWLWFVVLEISFNNDVRKKLTANENEWYSCLPFVTRDKSQKERNMPWPGIEPGTFRSSVWRSPDWAIPAILTSDTVSLITAIPSHIWRLRGFLFNDEEESSALSRLFSVDLLDRSMYCTRETSLNSVEYVPEYILRLLYALSNSNEDHWLFISSIRQSWPIAECHIDRWFEDLSWCEAVDCSDTTSKGSRRVCHCRVSHGCGYSHRWSKCQCHRELFHRSEFLSRGFEFFDDVCDPEEWIWHRFSGDSDW